MTTCAKAEWIINHGESALQPESRTTSLMLTYKKSEVHYEPVGVVAAIVSWNYRTSHSALLQKPPFNMIYLSASQCLVTHPSCPFCR